MRKGTDRQTDRQTEMGWGGGVLASFKCKGSYWLLNQMLVLKGVDDKRMQEASPRCIAGVPALQGTRTLGRISCVECRSLFTLCLLSDLVFRPEIFVF